MLGKLFLISSLGLLLGCAHPNYGDVSGLKDHVQNQNDSTVISFPGTGLLSRAELSWEKIQTEDDTGSFYLRLGFLDAGNHFVLQDPTELQIRLWMPSMGHGSSPLTITKTSTGTYHVTGVWFSMPGVWEIQMKLQDQNGVASESFLSLRY